jgi:REP element-mobilizing transposase RayT
MSYNPEIHKRKSIRLKGYDYSQEGLYFITLCCQNRECLFGQIHNGSMILNDAGKMIENEWLNLENRFPNIELHEFIVMPNHFHGILKIVGAALAVAQSTPVRAALVDAQSTLAVAQNEMETQTIEGQPQGIAPTKTIGDMMGAFKSITTVEYIRGVKNLGWKPFDGKIWQRNYYEHIIRNEQSYQNISNYIINNPAKWQDDKFYGQ